MEEQIISNFSTIVEITDLQKEVALKCLQEWKKCVDPSKQFYRLFDVNLSREEQENNFQELLFLMRKGECDTQKMMNAKQHIGMTFWKNTRNLDVNQLIQYINNKSSLENNKEPQIEVSRIQKWQQEIKNADKYFEFLNYEQISFILIEVELEKERSNALEQNSKFHDQVYLIASIERNMRKQRWSASQKQEIFHKLKKIGDWVKTQSIQSTENAVKDFKIKMCLGIPVVEQFYKYNNVVVTPKCQIDEESLRLFKRQRTFNFQEDAKIISKYHQFIWQVDLRYEEKEQYSRLDNETIEKIRFLISFIFFQRSSSHILRLKIRQCILEEKDITHLISRIQNPDITEYLIINGLYFKPSLPLLFFPSELEYHIKEYFKHQAIEQGVSQQFHEFLLFQYHNMISKNVIFTPSILKLYGLFDVQELALIESFTINVLLSQDTLKMILSSIEKNKIEIRKNPYQNLNGEKAHAYFSQKLQEIELAKLEVLKQQGENYKYLNSQPVCQKFRLLLTRSSKLKKQQTILEEMMQSFEYQGILTKLSHDDDYSI